MWSVSEFVITLSTKVFLIEIEQESDILIADYSFDECSFFKDDDDDDMCA